MPHQSTDSDVGIGGDSARQTGRSYSPAADLRRAYELVCRAHDELEDPAPDLTATFARLLTLLDGLDRDVTTGIGSVHRDRQAIETLDLLGDESCRSILRATTGRSMTVSEIEAACEIPSSTAYRKLDRLTSASLLETDVRIGSDGPHATEYRQSVTDLLVTLDPTLSTTLWNRDLGVGTTGSRGWRQSHSGPNVDGES